MSDAVPSNPPLTTQYDVFLSILLRLSGAGMNVRSDRGYNWIQAEGGSPLGYNKLKQARLDAGLCLRCGAERGEGSTRLNCADCARTSGPRHARTYREDIREGESLQKGGRKRRGRESEQARTSRRRTLLRLRWRPRRLPQHASARPAAETSIAGRRTIGSGSATRPSGGAVRVPPWPMGAALPRLEGGGHRYRLGLTIPAVRRPRPDPRPLPQTERAAGHIPKTHQVSRLVREAIHKWRRSPAPTPQGEVWIVETVNVTLDAPSRQIVRWQADAALRRQRQRRPARDPDPQRPAQRHRRHRRTQTLGIGAVETAAGRHVAALNGKSSAALFPLSQPWERGLEGEGG